MSEKKIGGGDYSFVAKRRKQEGNKTPTLETADIPRGDVVGQQNDDIAIGRIRKIESADEPVEAIEDKDKRVVARIEIITADELDWDSAVAALKEIMDLLTEVSDDEKEQKNSRVTFTAIHTFTLNVSGVEHPFSLHRSVDSPVTYSILPVTMSADTLKLLQQSSM